MKDENYFFGKYHNMYPETKFEIIAQVGNLKDEFEMIFYE